MASTAGPPIAITISAKLKNVSEFVQCIVFISLLAAVGFCYLHGIMARPGATCIKNPVVAVIFPKRNSSNCDAATQVWARE